MEKAIKIDIRNMDSKKIDKYDCIYFGSEFCENLIPVYRNELERIFDSGKKVCILTPIITDRGLVELNLLIKKLRRYDNFEITVNDFGTLMLINEMGLKCKINVGRHLSKLFFTFRKNYININNKKSVKFLADIGIDTFEISNFLFSDKDMWIYIGSSKVKFNIYYPYVLLSTTRTCLTGLPDIGPEKSVKTVNCKNECLLCDYYVRTEKIKEKLVISDNSTFIKNSNNMIFKENFGLDINRSVFCVRP
jgi:hypothetical protein